MPLTLFKKLGIETLKPTPMTLQFADQIIKRPLGIVENVIVQYKNKYVPCDFVIFDMKTDDHVPLILGIPFLATAKGSLDFASSKLKFHINREEIEYDFSKSHKYEDDKGYRIVIDRIEILTENCLEHAIEDLMNCHINFNDSPEDLDKPPDIKNSSDIFEESQEFIDDFKKLINNLNQKKVNYLDNINPGKPNPE